ncbi:MAG: flippase-like domain-containing protein, partial [Anaerolineales bacterium]|nr:flippase-like domain-containing protein [Anaerolineales bacterium]
MTTWKRLLKTLLAILRVALGAGLLIYVLSVTGGWQTLRQLRQHGWVLVGLLALPLFGAAVEAVRLRLLARAHHIPLSLGRGYRLVAVGALFNFAIPGGTGGDVMKLYYLATANRRQVVEAATIVFVDRLVALFSMLWLMLALALLNWPLLQAYALIRLLVGVVVLGIAGLALVAAVSFSARWRRSRLYRWIMARLPLRAHVERLFDALIAYRDHKRALAAAAAWSLVGHLALSTMFLAVGRALIPAAPPQIIPFLALLGVLVNIIPITPGGLGVGEAALEQLFALVGYSGGAALMLAWRLSMLPLCALGALFYAAGMRTLPGTTG